MRTSIFLFIASVLLAGCATSPEQRAAAMQAEMDRMIRVYGPACAKLGFAANSDPWRNCLLQLSTKDDIQRYGYYPPYPHYYGRPYWGPYW